MKTVQVNRWTYLEIETRVENNNFLNKFGSYSVVGVQMTTRHTLVSGDYIERARARGQTVYYVTQNLLDEYNALVEAEKAAKRAVVAC